MSTSVDPKPTTSSPAHSRMRALPSRPVAPTIIAFIFVVFSALFESLGVAKKHAALVLRRHDRVALQFPFDLQVRIIPDQRALVFGSVEIGRFVEDLCLLRNHAKSVGEPCGDP